MEVVDNNRLVLDEVNVGFGLSDLGNSFYHGFDPLDEHSANSRSSVNLHVVLLAALHLRVCQHLLPKQLLHVSLEIRVVLNSLIKEKFQIKECGVEIEIIRVRKRFAVGNVTEQVHIILEFLHIRKLH